ncbi:MAG: hypothetical protein KBC42_02445 [Candidatus Pacebacteria bacterium]|jgi:hypothetical protein|nr:hypothetical protein [Candidatus Paceibacterota bacterium]MBP9780763.1 hypothetical protein [Candidatus Paceibacterota bacterium]
MKIMVINYRSANHPFEVTGHECVVCDLKSALMTLVAEEPDVILAFVEYCDEEENLALLEDVKRSMLNSTKFTRLGFMEDRKIEGERYLQFPYSEEQFQQALS